MNAKTRNMVGTVAAVLTFIYLVLFFTAFHGYGYAGHGGFHVPASS